MALSGVDIEIVATFLWECLWSARLELLCASMFLGGWLLGMFRKKQHKPKFIKSGFKRCQGEKVMPGRKRPAKPSEKKGHGATALYGGIENVDSALLKDASWVVPQVAQLCNTQVPEALLLYRSAVNAGLQLADVPPEQCRQLFAALVTATVRIGKVDECIELLSELRRCGLGVGGGLFASAVKLCTSKHLFEECLGLFDFMSDDPSFTITDKSIWSCLLFCATEAKAYQRCNQFFERMKACGTPSSKDFCNIGVEIDNMQYNVALATCVAAGKVDEASSLLDTMGGEVGAADVITYNTMMKGYAKAGRINECFKLLECMRTNGISSSQVTCGILLDCCINENQMDRALQVFDDMTASGCQMNTVIYTTLIKGFARAGELEKALNLYKQMKNEHSILPDLITFSILIKATCDNDNLEDALMLLEEMSSLGLKPDEVVFNNLIAGCVRHGNATLGKQLYDDMVKSGVRPSNATFSILIRLYHQCKILDEAVILLKTEPSKHHMVLEARIFLQLMQSCVRERQGKRAIEVYGMLSELSTPTAAMHSSVLSTCMKMNMYDTAAEIVSIAVASSACVDACDARSLLEAAHKKGKGQVVRSIIASMRTLGYAIDHKFLQSLEPDIMPKHLGSRHSCGDSHQSVRASNAALRAPWRSEGGALKQVVAC